jgi:hypothetical protein
MMKKKKSRVVSWQQETEKGEREGKRLDSKHRKCELNIQLCAHLSKVMQKREKRMREVRRKKEGD